MQSIDAFWKSNTSAVTYGPDQPQVQGNAYSEPDGYIYFDPALLAAEDSASYSFAPSQMILAHEFGHQIQFAYGTFQGGTIGDELGADCLSGYFIGGLICGMTISMNDLQADFMTMCSLGNAGASLPWWAPGAHGNCQQRTAAFQQGISAYQQQIPPLNACTIRFP